MTADALRPQPRAAAIQNKAARGCHAPDRNRPAVASPSGSRIRRHVGVLLRADESLMRARAARDIAQVAGSVLPLEPAQPGRAYVVIPRRRVQKFRARGIRIHRSGRARPVGEYELVLRSRMKNLRLPAQMIEERFREESAVVERDCRLPSAFRGVSTESGSATNR